MTPVGGAKAILSRTAGGRYFTEAQQLDALERRVVWNADPCHDSANLQEEESVRQPPALLGIRLDDGTVAPMPVSDTNALMEVDELEYRGQSEEIPGRVSELVSFH